MTAEQSHTTHFHSLKLQFLFLVILFAACKTDRLDPMQEDPGYDYFPLHTGDYRTYQVTEKNYPNGVEEEENYYLKEVVVDSFMNETGTYSYLLNRYRRPSDTTSWDLAPVSVWTARKTDQQVVVNEGNTPYIKLVFPVREGFQWDGNALNTETEMSYTYTFSTDQLVIPADTFEKVLKVRQNDFIALNRKDVRNEYYLEYIGLIYKQYEVLDYIADPDHPDYGKDIITSGRILTMELIDYGNE